MSKKLFIIGDSWGVGSYQYIGNPPRAIEPIPNTGIDYFLKDQYQIKNFSRSGSSNTEQLHILAQQLQIEKPDQIIWFHTELTRDAIVKGYYSKSYRSLLNTAYKNNFDQAQAISEIYDVPFAVIGCLSPAINLEAYTFHNIVIESWFKELLDFDYEIPYCLHTNNFREVADNCHFIDKEFVNSEIDKMIYLEDFLEQHKNFSNGIHPSVDSVQRLANRLSCLL